MLLTENYDQNNITIKNNGILLTKVYYLSRVGYDPTKVKQDIIDTDITYRMHYINKNEIKLCKLFLNEIIITINNDKVYNIHFGKDRNDFAKELFDTIIDFIDEDVIAG